LEVHVLGLGSRWADRSRPTIAASRGGGSKLNRGLFKIFLKFFYLYLPDVHVDYHPRMLRPSTAHLLQRPLVLTSVASRAFAVAAPTVWNALSVNVRSADSFVSFKRRPKAELFATLHLLMPLWTVQRQRHCSAPIRVFSRPNTLYKFHQ